MAKLINLKFNKLDAFYIYNITFMENDEYFVTKIYKKYNNNLTLKNKKILRNKLLIKT